MSLTNIRKDMTPFDMTEKPVKQFLPLAWLLWGASYILTARFKLKPERIGMKGLKGPFLVLSTHQGFSDYFIAPRMLFPRRANYVSDMEGFANYGKLLYKHGGCIGKRRYVSDVSVVKNIRHALFQLKQPVVLFPESRHSDAGITSSLPDNLGKLVKTLQVPLVLLTAHGSYLANPFWDETHTRKSRMSARLELVYTADDVQKLSSAEIQKTIEEKLSYDEYKWQADKHVKIDNPKRAEGLHKPLYKCLNCNTEGAMTSEGTKLWCTSCNAPWHMTEYGQLVSETEPKKSIHIPDWYVWEREQLKKELLTGSYRGINIPVTVEALPNEKGFVPLGNGRLIHTRSGYTLHLDSPDSEAVKKSPDSFPLVIPNRTLESTQTEYDYRGKGKAIVLSTQNCCYYVYSDAPEFLVTKLEFAVEEINKLR